MNNNIVASATQLIRKPPQVVFNAFVEPHIIKQFWLKNTSGPLARNTVVTWEFMVEGAVETVTVTEFVANQIIAFTWSDGIAVRLQFDWHNTTSTKLAITATGFTGTDATAEVIGATEGFTIVACDLKSLLETGRSGNMVRDKAELVSVNNLGN